MNTAEKLTAIAENQPKVYDKGKYDEWSYFWDIYQEKGTRGMYFYAFAGYAWEDNIFRPKYDMKLLYSNTNMFNYSCLTDLAELFEKQGVILDTSRATNLTNAFSNMQSCTRLPAIDTSGITLTSYCNAICDGSAKLHTIEKFKFKEGMAVSYQNAFRSCSSLTNVVFEGVLYASLNLQWSPLSVESLKTLILCLEDYAGTQEGGTKVITLKDECKTALEAEGATSPNGNLWTEYVSDLGWVLA